MRIGIDAGGTFTDFVVLNDGGELASFKLRSNPANPAQVILEGIARAAAGTAVADVVHGSTVATNALLERKGARTAFVTTAGFEDLLEIGRQFRPELYNLMPPLRREIVPPELRFSVRGRMLFDGTELFQIPAEDLDLVANAMRDAVRDKNVESVAICLIHAYENPSQEQEVLAALQGSGYVCASHEISPEFREYERASTTVINAYVGPLMDRYLAELERGSPYPVAIMQSSGGFLTATEARKHAVRTVLSGPAGGIVGASAMARASGFPRALSFDMGGTSTDVSLCDAELRLTTESTIDGFPIRIPMLDIHTVGAGGGSLARVDEGGRLLVGPESAGASPGPSCYGTGEGATVTDAHVVLGRISADQFLGGEMRLFPERAEAAIDRIAKAMDTSREQAALGIIRIANANMERAIRVVSVERGQDPRDFPLVAFGGCGGLHACEMAAELGIPTVLIPPYAGALSALGMLLADRSRDYSAAALHAADLAARYGRLEEEAERDVPGATLQRFADFRYQGQSYELTVPWQPENPERLFHEEHRKVYGYADPERPSEVVTLRLRATKSDVRPALRMTPADLPPGEPVFRNVNLDGEWSNVPVLSRDRITEETKGPLLVLDYGSTTTVPRGWSARLDAAGNLLIHDQIDRR